MEKLEAFIKWCEMLGVRGGDSVKLDACRPLGGDGEIYFTLDQLREILAFAKRGQ